MAIIIAGFCIFLLTICSEAQQYQNSRHRFNYNNFSATTTVGNEEILQRIYDQVLASSNFNEKQHKKIENLEKLLQRFELQDRDQLIAIQNEIRELGRQLQSLEYTFARSEGNVNQLKTDFDELRHKLASNSHVGKRQNHQPLPTFSSTDLDCSEKLEALTTFLSSIRQAVHRIEKQTNKLDANVTNLIETSKDISVQQTKLPTKEYLQSVVSTLRSQQYGAITHGRGNQYNSIPPSCSHAGPISGITKIQIGSTKQSFYVMCDNEIDGGGWTVIQKRQDGTINFNRHWTEYQNGFGNLLGEFFIGLDKLHDITSAMLHELLIVLEDFDGQIKTAKYSQFAIGGEKEDYALQILGKYEGDAGDALSYSASYKFSTFDNDNDGWVEGNCAAAHTGAWWYNACEMSNLNGQYLSGEVSDASTFQGVYWNSFRGPRYSLKSVKMLIRPLERIFLENYN